MHNLLFQPILHLLSHLHQEMSGNVCFVFQGRGPEKHHSNIDAEIDSLTCMLADLDSHPHSTSTQVIIIKNDTAVVSLCLVLAIKEIEFRNAVSVVSVVDLYFEFRGASLAILLKRFEIFMNWALQKSRI